jgi:hypothetical protein
LGDIFLGNPPLLYGISDMRFGPFYDYAMTHLTSDQFMLVRSSLDLSVVMVLLLAHKKIFSVHKMFSSDREVVVALPILVVLIVSIFITSQIHDRALLFRNHDWSLFISAYSILIISHLLVLFVVIMEARRYVRAKADPVKSL